MPSWPVSFLAAPVAAAVSGFDAAPGIAALLAKSLFGVFTFLFVLAALSAMRLVRATHTNYDGY